MYWDRFDILEAYYVYAMDYHGGQWSVEYALHSVFGRLRYKPRLFISDRTSMSENARSILASLLCRNRRYLQGKTLATTLCDRR